MNAIALDPGITTGYAVGSITDEKMLVITGESKWSHFDLWKFLGGHTPSFIVCEHFQFRHGVHKHHGVEMFPRELIGVVMLYEQMYGNCEIRLQPAMKSSPTTFYNDNRLRQLGIFKSGKGHANDAARHLCHWAKFKSGSQYVKEIRSGVLV